MGKKGTVLKSKPKKRVTMNEMVMDMPNEAHSTIIMPNEALIDANTGMRLIADIREDERVISIMDYNRSILNLEEEYIQDSLVFTTGQVLIRLFRRLPVERGLYAGYTTPIIGSKQLKYEEATDPYHFSNVGVIVNFDQSYRKRDPWLLEPGDVVQVNPIETVTIIEKQVNQPHLRRQFGIYKERRKYQDLGYILVTSSEVIAKLPKFDLEEYHEEFFK